MDIRVGNQNNTARVSLSGQFTFADNNKFKEILELTGRDGVGNIELDFGGINFIDSAGLGMLLLLRDACQSKNISISLHAPKGQVEKIFLLSKFDHLFSIQS